MGSDTSVMLASCGKPPKVKCQNTDVELVVYLAP